jgi:hypothetical protein
MARLGNLDIPNYPLIESVEAVKKIYEKLGRGEITNEHIAGTLGLAPRSGGFNVRLFDLKLYGFVEGRGMKMRVTELAVKATFGTQEEISSALDSALKNVPLWRTISEKWGKSIPAETFYIDLATMAGVERSESKLQADKVRKFYMDEAKYLLIVKQPPADPEPQNDEQLKSSEKSTGGARDRRPKMEATESSGFVHIKWPGCCDAIIDLQDTNSMTAIESMLSIIKPKLPKGEEIPKDMKGNDGKKDDRNPNSNDTE